jgi:hypothetical protein
VKNNFAEEASQDIYKICINLKPGVSVTVNIFEQFLPLFGGNGCAFLKNHCCNDVLCISVF